MKYAAATTAFAILFLGAAAAQQAYQLGILVPHNVGSGFLPFVCALALVALAGAEAVSTLRTADSGQGFWLGAGQGWAAMGIFAVLLIFVLTLDIVGFTVASFLLVFGMMKVLGHYRVLSALAAGLIAAAIVRIVFETSLQMPLPKGILGF